MENFGILNDYGSIIEIFLIGSFIHILEIHWNLKWFFYHFLEIHCQDSYIRVI